VDVAVEAEGEGDGEEELLELSSDPSPPEPVPPVGVADGVVPSELPGLLLDAPTLGGIAAIGPEVEVW
jgi:hypothetical protein